jgi:hypothetical protein
MLPHAPLRHLLFAAGAPGVHHAARRAFEETIRDLLAMWRMDTDSLTVVTALDELCETHATDTVVLSGGVFQNELLLSDVAAMIAATRLRVWTNRARHHGERPQGDRRPSDPRVRAVRLID